VGSEGHKLACYERVSVLVARGTQGGAIEKRGQVERSQGIQDNDLVGSICVNRLVKREVGRVIVVGEV
jgi:hypothetical protein